MHQAINSKNSFPVTFFFPPHQGDVFQQGGALVVGPGNNVHYAHQDANPADHANIDDLLVAAGLPTFFKDKESGSSPAAAAGASEADGSAAASASQ